MSNELNDYFIKNIGSNRGSRRIWLQGADISRAGLGKGDLYEVISEGQSLTIKALKDGSKTLTNGKPRVVSGKQKNGREVPVIDINNDELLRIFDGMDSVRMIVRKNEVVFVPMASEMRKRERLNRIRKKLAAGIPLKVGSAFHGGGVLSHAVHEGLERAGIKTEAAFVNEIREDLLTHAVEHNDTIGDKTMLIAAPAQEVVQDQWLMSQLPTVDILELGIPCSGASVAGRAKRGLDMPEAHEEVGHLVFSALVILNKVQPVCLLIENVPQYANTASANILRYQLRDMGYDTHEAVLNGKDFGSLEARERWCLVAVTRGLEFSFDQLVPKPFEVKALGHYLDDIPEDDPSWSEMRGLKDKQDRDKAAGKGFRMQVFGPEDSKIATITKGYAKVRSTDPKIRHPSNPDLLRQLTPQEHARIKQVPEKLIEGLSATLAHELLGQGIVYEPFAQTAQLLGNSIKASVEKGVSKERVQGGQARKSGLSVG